MQRILIDFEGWIACDPTSVSFSEIDDSGELITKTAKQWIAERGNLDGLIVYDFGDAYRHSIDGEFGYLNTEVEDE